jgi:hypothetical protein
MYPINGTRSKLAPPPGWRPPLDWASYPRPLDQLQAKPSIGAVPSESIMRVLDYQHGERGRLVYDCDRKWWMAGFCLKNN